MPQLAVQKSISGLAGLSEAQTLTDNEGIIANPAVVPAAQPAVLSTRTNNTDGTLTMTNTNHGIVTGQRLDLYWNIAGVMGARWNVTVGTVSGTSVPFVGSATGGGTNLPIATSAIVAGLPTVVGFGVTGNNLTALALSAGTGPQQCYFVFNTGSADIGAILLGPPYQATPFPPTPIYLWYGGQGITNPLAGDTVGVVYMSHDYTAAAVANMNAMALTH